MSRTLVHGGPSPAGDSTMGPARRCLNLWSLNRPEEADPEDPVPDLTEAIPSFLGGPVDESTWLPFMRGIIAHGAVGQTWRRQQALMEGGDPSQWATWTYALAWHLAYAAAPRPETAEQAAKLDARAEQIATWVEDTSPRDRIARLYRAAEHTWPGAKLVIDGVRKWHRERWTDEADKVHVLSVEHPIMIWLDPAKVVEGHPDPKLRYGVVDPPPDADERCNLLRNLRGPHWRMALRLFLERGAPWPASTREDMRFRAPGVDPGTFDVFVVDLKTGMRTGTDSKHRGYQNTGQIEIIDIHGRCYVPDYKGVMIEYLPWVGKPKGALCNVAESHRRDLAWTVQEQYRGLWRNLQRPRGRWTKTLTEEGCRTIYNDPCPHYDACRTLNLG